jgi:hypothetical protein
VVKAVQGSGWQRRFTIVALCFVAFMLCNMDRVNMSIAILPMSKQFGWDSATIGLVQSSFFWCRTALSEGAAFMLCPRTHALAQGVYRMHCLRYSEGV